MSQGSTLRKVLAEQAVRVLVGAALPGVAGVTEVDGDPGLDCEALVLRHLSALIPSQRAPQAERQLDDAGGNALAHGLSSGPACQGEEHHVARAALDQRAYGGARCAQEEVTL